MEPIHVVGAIFIAYIVVKEVFVLVKGETKQIAKDMAAMREAFLTKGVDNKTPVEQIADIYVSSVYVRANIEKVIDYTEELYKWHDKEDDDGVKIWYVRRSLEQTLKKLPLTLDKQRDIMESLMRLFDRLQEDINSVKDRLNTGEDDSI